MKNLIFASISALPFFAATIDGRDILSLVFTAILSITLMAFGKLADFAIKFFFLRYTERRNGSSPSRNTDALTDR
jgi:hypothetical protein